MSTINLGGCCNRLPVLIRTVKIWTVINWTVITNPNPYTNFNPNKNPNPNPSRNPVLTVQVLTVQISSGCHCNDRCSLGWNFSSRSTHRGSTVGRDFRVVGLQQQQRRRRLFLLNEEIAALCAQLPSYVAPVQSMYLNRKTLLGGMEGERVSAIPSYKTCLLKMSKYGSSG